MGGFTTRSHLRWAALALAPFIHVPLIGAAILTPGVQLARSMKVPGQRLTDTQFAISAALACLTASAAAALGIWLARLLRALRTNRLATYLSSTEKG